MRTTPGSRPAFATSVNASTTSATRIETGALVRHVASCEACAERLFQFRSAMDVLDTFAAPRLVSTLAVFAASLGLLCLFLS